MCLGDFSSSRWWEVVDDVESLSMAEILIRDERHGQDSRDGIGLPLRGPKAVVYGVTVDGESVVAMIGNARDIVSSPHTKHC